jgi:hypothetical protein
MSHVIRALVLALIGVAWFWVVALGPGLLVVFLVSAFPLLWGVPLALAVLLWRRYGFAFAIAAVCAGVASTWLGIIAVAVREPYAFY